MVFNSSRLRVFVSVTSLVTASVAGGCSSSSPPSNDAPDSGASIDSGRVPPIDAAAPIDTGSDAKPAACTPNPSCAPEICDCATGPRLAVGTCSATCKYTTECQTACGSPAGGTLFDACQSASQCQGGAPTIFCQCNSGAWNAFGTCTPAGYCSSSPQDVCPDACKDSGSWVGCKSDADCAPVLCTCGDGSRPVDAARVGGILSGKCVSQGVCESPSDYCPTACAARGGWSGPTTHDAGTDAPATLGNPGDPCTSASQCKTQTCTCNDSNKFSGVSGCDNATNTCSGLDELCPFMCSNNGGWSGH